MNQPAQDAFRVVPCSSNTAGPAATREPARRWKRILPVFLFLISTGAALAQGTLVVPNVLANTEGNSSTSDPFTSSSFRLDFYGAPVPEPNTWALLTLGAAALLLRRKARPQPPAPPR